MIAFRSQRRASNDRAAKASDRDSDGNANAATCERMHFGGRRSPNTTAIRNRPAARTSDHQHTRLQPRCTDARVRPVGAMARPKSYSVRMP